MDISGFSSPPVRSTENNPRQRLTAESLPSLSQLRLLYEEAVQEETAPSPEEEPAAEPGENAPAFAASALRADIPTLSQLTALRSESAQQQERRQAAVAYEYARRAKAAEQPAPRNAAVSAVTPRQKKPAARYVRAVPAKREAVPQDEPLRRAVSRPAPAESRPAYVPEVRPAPAEEPRPALSAMDLPTLTQLSFLREEARADVSQDRLDTQDRLNTEELAPSAPAAPHSADCLPSLADLREMRSAVLREQGALRQSAAAKEPSPARAPEPIRRPAPRETEAPDESRSEPMKSRLEMLPTLAQLKAQLEEENLYGNLAFQDSVRQIKQVLTEDPPQPEEAKKPEQPAAAPKPTNGPQKVGYISYEDFLRDEEFDDFSGYSKNSDASAPRKGRMRGYAERADAPAQSRTAPRTEEFSDEEAAQVKKKRNQKIHIWMNSLLRSN